MSHYRKRKPGWMHPIEKYLVRCFTCQPIQDLTRPFRLTFYLDKLAILDSYFCKLRKGFCATSRIPRAVFCPWRQRPQPFCSLRYWLTSVFWRSLCQWACLILGQCFNRPAQSQKMSITLSSTESEYVSSSSTARESKLVVAELCYKSWGMGCKIPQESKVRFFRAIDWGNGASTGHFRKTENWIFAIIM